MRMFSICIALAGCFLALAANSARAQHYMSDYYGEPTHAVSTNSATMDAILNRLDKLEAVDDKDDGDGWVNVSGDKWKSKFGGRIMGDYVNYVNQTSGSLDRAGNAQDYMEFRRMRFFMEGEGYGVYVYKLQLDFEPEGNADGIDSAVAIKDVYVGLNEVPLLGTVLFGHAKEPFSLEELTSSKYITFMERGLPNIFAPSRNVGMEAFNENASESIGWGIGEFFNDIDEVDHERVSDNQGINVTGCVHGTPYYCEGGRHLFHVGLGGTWVDDRDNVVRWRSRPEVHEGPRYIDTGPIAADDYYTLDLEGALRVGSFFAAKRTVLQPRSCGCRGPELLRRLRLRQLVPDGRKPLLRARSRHVWSR